MTKEYTTIHKILSEYYYEQAIKYILTNDVDDIEDSYAIVNNIMALSLSPELIIKKYRMNKDVVINFVRDLHNTYTINIHAICESSLLKAYKFIYDLKEIEVNLLQ